MIKNFKNGKNLTFMFEGNMLFECLLGWEQIPAMFTAVFSVKVLTIHVFEHNILSAI